MIKKGLYNKKGLYIKKGLYLGRGLSPQPSTDPNIIPLVCGTGLFDFSVNRGNPLWTFPGR